MPHDANTFNACGEMMSGWQDSFFVEAEDFRAKAFMKWVGHQSATSGKPL